MTAADSVAEDTVPGTLYIVSAPSGAGKTSLVRGLIAMDAGMAVSISYTTRPMRPGEQADRDYHFVSHEQFREMIAQEAFLEHAEVFGNYYGTARHSVMAQLNRGRDVMLEIDWQGARQVRQRAVSCVSIFILPPSRRVLEQRLRGRNQDPDEVIALRMRQAVDEMSHYKEFAYLIINDDFDTALEELQAIIRVQHLQQSEQALRQRRLIAGLLA